MCHRLDGKDRLWRMDCETSRIEQGGTVKDDTRM